MCFALSNERMGMSDMYRAALMSSSRLRFCSHAGIAVSRLTMCMR